jgi:hypothetical protein
VWLAAIVGKFARNAAWRLLFERVWRDPNRIGS